INEVIVSGRIKTEWTEAVDVLVSLIPSSGREAKRLLRHSQLIWMWTSLYARTPEERMLAAFFTEAFGPEPDIPRFRPSRLGYYAHY
ncbi:hypothetical protein DRO69_10170, partial [Candidatus Bathyarchaeota archaeon]